MGRTYLRLKRFKEAKESFQESIEINPFDPEVHLGLATACEMLGEMSASLKERDIAKRLLQ
jgi:cytochrome c-type biogenesis protein CcmH/NrfG